MSDDDLEELRRRKLAQLQQEAAAQGHEDEARHQQQEDQEAQKEAILRQLLEPEARERLARVRLARPDVAESLERQIIVLAQQGRIRGKIDDNTLRDLLARVQPKARDINIERR